MMCQAASFNSSKELPLTKNCTTAVEKEKHMVDHESTVTKEVWVQLQHSTLTKENRLIIKRGHRLIDKHINFASSLISRQFPQIGGLEQLYSMQDTIVFLHRVFILSSVRDANIGSWHLI